MTEETSRKIYLFGTKKLVVILARSIRSYFTSSFMGPGFAEIETSLYGAPYFLTL